MTSQCQGETSNSPPQPEPFIEAMQHIKQWTAAFDDTDLDGVISQIKAFNAFEKSRRQYRLLNLSDLDDGSR